MDIILNDSLRNSISHLYFLKYRYFSNLEQVIDNHRQTEQLYHQIPEQLVAEESGFRQYLWIM